MDRPKFTLERVCEDGGYLPWRVRVAWEGSHYDNTSARGETPEDALDGLYSTLEQLLVDAYEAVDLIKLYLPKDAEGCEVINE